MRQNETGFAMGEALSTRGLGVSGIMCSCEEHAKGMKDQLAALRAHHATLNDSAFLAYLRDLLNTIRE